MTKIALLILLAFSMAIASGPATAGQAAECPMAGSSSGMMSHEDMGCCIPSCSPDCAIVCPSAVVPFSGYSLAAEPASGTLSPTPPAQFLLSAAPGAVDPPPRTTIS